MNNIQYKVQVIKSENQMQLVCFNLLPYLWRLDIGSSKILLNNLSLISHKEFLIISPCITFEKEKNKKKKHLFYRLHFIVCFFFVFFFKFQRYKKYLLLVLHWKFWLLLLFFFCYCCSFNPTALRMAKTQWSSGHSKCNRVNQRKEFKKKKAYLLVQETKFIFSPIKVLSFQCTL